MLVVRNNHHCITNTSEDNLTDDDTADEIMTTRMLLQTLKEENPSGELVRAPYFISQDAGSVPASDPGSTAWGNRKHKLALVST